MHLIGHKIKRLGLWQPAHLANEILTEYFLLFWVLQERNFRLEIVLFELLADLCISNFK